MHAIVAPAIALSRRGAYCTMVKVSGQESLIKLQLANDRSAPRDRPPARCKLLKHALDLHARSVGCFDIVWSGEKRVSIH